MTDSQGLQSIGDGPVALETAHLRLEQVTKRFGGVTAVDGVSLLLPRGAFITLLGPSGCGKTTLLRLIAGFYEPDDGAILLNDRRLNDVPAHRRGMAMVFQDYALFPHMRLADNVAYGLRLAKRPRAEIEQRVAETLALVGLSGLGERWPNELSGGQQQRVALARALVVQPEVLLLDEPLSNLDAQLRERMRWELRAMQRRLNLTFVYVTHDQDEALAMSDHIAVMNRGRVEQWGTPWEIYYRPRTPFLAEFVGAVNLIPATVVEHHPGELVVTVAGQSLRLPAPAEPVGQQVRLCIRPESVLISPEIGTASGLRLSGTIVRQAFLGHLMRYWVHVAAPERDPQPRASVDKVGRPSHERGPGHEWIVDQPDPGGGSGVLRGQVELTIKPERIHIMVEPDDGQATTAGHQTQTLGSPVGS